MSFFIDEEVFVYIFVIVSIFFNRFSELYNVFRFIVLDFILTCRLFRIFIFKMYFVIIFIR